MKDIAKEKNLMQNDDIKAESLKYVFLGEARQVF